MIDLDDIKKRIPKYGGGDIKALVEEVERLRGECGKAYLQGVAAGRDAERIAERAAVVAWIKRDSLEPDRRYSEMLLMGWIAQEIERGEHRREEER